MVDFKAHQERWAAEQGHTTKDPIEQENRLAERASNLFCDILRDYCGPNDLAPFPGKYKNTVILREQGDVNSRTEMRIIVNADETYSIEGQGSGGRHEGVSEEQMAKLVDEWYRAHTPPARQT
jgi:hypothetical protein